MDSAQRDADQRISWRNHHKTPLDLRRPIGENLLPFQVLGSSVTLPAKVPKMQIANSSRVTQFFKTLWSYLLPALENTDPALEDALTYMQLIYPLSRAA